MERCCKGAFGYTQLRVQSIIAIIVPEMALSRPGYCQEISTRFQAKQFGLIPIIWIISIIFDHPILPYINWVLGLYNDHIPEVLLPECLFLRFRKRIYLHTKTFCCITRSAPAIRTTYIPEAVLPSWILTGPLRPPIFSVSTTCPPAFTISTV